MRPFEILLLAALAGAVLALARPRLRPPALILLTLALFLHGAGEGPRWQMLPAYGLAMALGLLLLRAPEHRPRRWAVAAAGLAVALAALPPVALPVFRLPSPDGPYAVGRTGFDWTDPARPEIFTADPSDHRRLAVQVWYPAERPKRTRQPGAPYLTDTAALAPMARLLKLPAFMLGHLGLIRTNAVTDAPAAPGRFPVLIFAHGRGGYAQHNSVQAEYLASHGYIVVAMAQPYAASGVSFPDGRRLDFDPRMMDRRFIDRVIPFLASDAGFVLDRLAGVDASGPLAGRLDLIRTGMFGLSLGGAVTAQACLTETRIKACLPMDVFMPAAVVKRGLTQPTLWLSRDADTMRREGWREADVVETQTTMRAAFDRLPGEGWIVRAPGFYHQDFSDMPLFLSPRWAAGWGWMARSSRAGRSPSSTPTAWPSSTSP